jgi:uncharacterized heparinase superfamily protein
VALTRMQRGKLLARTVRYLRPAQVGHRARLRTQRAVLARASATAQRLLTPRLDTDHAGWPTGFRPLDARATSPWPDPGLLAAGRVRLLGHEAPIGDWTAAHLPQLWSYHLHYWDWAWPLALAAEAHANLFAELVRSWRRSTTFGQGDAWSPYVASLRAWSWCGQYGPLVRGTALEADLLAMLRLHTGFLRAHLELDVRGNHLVKNLKALLGLGVFFDDRALVHGTLARLRHEVDRQVLADGGHYERAPAYHCQVLGDLIDVADLLTATGGTPPIWLADAVESMRRFLGIVLLPDGTVPLLNDGYPVPADVVAALAPGPPGHVGGVVLSDSGLVALRMGELFVLADVGDPCPDELPAHAHADTLSFLLYDGAQPVVTEVGTSTYAPGARRAAERATRAHSTVEIDGADSTEVWSTFRAARRARVSGLDCHLDGDAVVLVAEHDGYHRLPGAPTHRRTWRLNPAGLTVRDEVDGAGQHEVVVRVVLAPGLGERESARFGRDWRMYVTEVAGGWQRIQVSRVLCHGGRVELPWSHEFRYESRPADETDPQ